MRAERISVYLVRSSYTISALQSEMTYDRAHEVAAGRTTGTLLVRVGEPRPPAWAELLSDSTQPPLDVTTQSASAVLLLSVRARLFAITYGSGRYMLPRGSFEKKFGRRTALNGVDPRQLRTIAARTFNEHALHTDRQLSRLADVAGFELNTQRDLVTSITGATADAKLGVKIGGRDSVQLTAELRPSDLADKCAALYALSRADTYRENFPWIDTIEEIEELSEIQRLTDAAMARLAAGDMSDFDLMPPEIPDGRITYFTIFGTDTTMVEPDTRLLRQLLARDRRRASHIETRLKNASLLGRDNDREIHGEWSVFDCLHYEHADSDGLTVLDGGTWYRIERNFASDVLSFAQTLGPSGLAYPDARQGEREDAYNERVAASRPGMTLLDRRLIRLTGQTPIEPCDLFSRQRHMVHVKRRKGGSSTLSHLFAQASVSADAVLLSSDFRSDLRDLLNNATEGLGRCIREPGHARDYSVVFALITHKTVPEPVAASLPFFAKVHLRMVVQRLQVAGFGVYLDQIATSVASGTGARPRPRRRSRERAPRSSKATKATA